MNTKELTPILLMGILIAVLVISVYEISLLWPKYEEKYFELAILDKDKMTDSYYPNHNSSIEANTTILWYIYIRNRMHEPQNVSIRIKLLNSTMQFPEDNLHSPSPYPYVLQIPLALDVDEAEFVPFSWYVSNITSEFVKPGQDLVTVLGLKINEKTYNPNLNAYSDELFHVIFELWVYDERVKDFKFEWYSGKGFYSISLHMGFYLIVTD